MTYMFYNPMYFYCTDTVIRDYKCFEQRRRIRLIETTVIDLRYHCPLITRMRRMTGSGPVMDLTRVRLDRSILRWSKTVVPSALLLAFEWVVSGSAWAVLA